MTTKAVKRKAFEVPKGFLEHISSIKDKKLVGEIQALCERVEQLVMELGIPDECTGFITDGDLAIPWKDCFSKENQETKFVGCSRLFSLGSCLTRP